jgi:nickel-dependent lactate racemase
VIRSRYIPGCADEYQAIQEALRYPIASAPLAEIVNPGQSVVIVHTDITRATPNDRLLPVILGELEAAGVRPEDITLLNGLGTHRPQSKVELRQMLGDKVFERYRCLQHDCRDDDELVDLGVTSFGNPVRVNKTYLQADVRILTGFIEPHLFAGYSGGPKAILPALSGLESVATNHSAANIAHPQATWGVTTGNPVWEEMREVALKTEPTFLVNIALNRDNQITAVFAGDMMAAHGGGCEFVGQSALVPVEEDFDIVITTNSGYPLDQNLYQSIKGMRVAQRVVRKGGTIICAAACEEGVPAYGGYADLLRQGGSPRGVLEMVMTPGFHEHDMWQVQIQAMVQLWADVYVYSHGLTPQEIEAALFLPCQEISATLQDLQCKYGQQASIAVIPEGPQTIPFRP